MTMTNLYKINDTDVFTTYGLLAKRGLYNELLKAAKPKGGYSKNWPDQDGTERDLSQVYYETRILNLPFLLKATSEAEFYTKYANLQLAIAPTARFNFDVVNMGRRYKFLYQDMTSFNKLTIIKNNNNIFAEVTIQVADDYPNTKFIIP